MQEAEFLSQMRAGYPTTDTIPSRVDFITEGESPGPWGCDTEDKPCIMVQIPAERPTKSKFVAADIPIGIETHPQLQKRRLSSDSPYSWRGVLQSFKVQNEKVQETANGINKLKKALEGKRKL